MGSFITSILKSKHGYPVILLAFAVVVCAAYLIDIYDWPGASIKGHCSESYCVSNIFTDMKVYLKNAQGVCKGTWPDSVFFRAPFYSYFLALLISIQDRILWIVCVQAVFAIVTIGLTYQLGALVFDKRVGLLAGSLLTLYGGYVYFVAIPHTAVMEVFFATGSLLSLLYLRRKFCYHNAVIHGVLAGFLCLVRPNYLIICVPAIVGISVEHIYADWSRLRRQLAVGCVACMGFVAVLAPFVVWNNLHSDRLVLYCTNSTNFPTANSYDSVVFNYIHPKKPMMPLDSWVFWRHQLRKGVAYWKCVEYPQNVNFTLFRSYSHVLPMLAVNFSIIGALFVAASVFYADRLRIYWPFYIYCWLYIGTIVAFFIIGRFRLPAVPAMAVLLSGYVFEVTKFFRRGAYKRAAFGKRMQLFASLLCMVVVLVISEPWWKSVHSFNHSSSLSRKYFLHLDLDKYVYWQEQLLDQEFEIPAKNIIAASMINSKPDVAQHYLLLCRERSIPISPTMLYEMGLLDSVNKRECELDVWLQYVEESPNRGHIAQVYLGYLEAFSICREFSLPIAGDAEKVPANRDIRLLLQRLAHHGQRKVSGEAGSTQK